MDGWMEGVKMNTSGLTTTINKIVYETAVKIILHGHISYS
jgi:hypothetical protein